MTDAAQTVRPLDGLRVLDVSTFIAGPYCAAIMGEFGAEVIKVEQPGTGDSARGFGTPTTRKTSTLGTGDTLNWLNEGRNKRSITLDLQHPKGKKLFQDLVAKSDVLIENFRTGTLEKWGLGYEDLSKLNPGLVMVRITGYGQTGPYKNRPGFARIAHAFGGLTYLSGMPGGTPVVPGSTSLADYMSGMYGAIGTMMALKAREKTGEGQYIDVGLYESVLRVLDEIGLAYDRHGFVRERLGPATVNVCPHSHYKTGDDKWIAIACSNDKMFERLARAMGRPELASKEQYGPGHQRVPKQPEVDALVSAWTESLPREELLKRCAECDVPAGPINSIADIFADPHVQARENFVKMTAEGLDGTFMVPNVVPRLSKTPGRVDSLGEGLGASNAKVYSEVMGLSEAEIAALKEEGVI
ncbi:MAG: CaiB/BaiF CoA transferase family protein [Alphaproteobacteria bacterium]